MTLPDHLLPAAGEVSVVHPSQVNSRRVADAGVDAVRLLVGAVGNLDALRRQLLTGLAAVVSDEANPATRRGPRDLSDLGGLWQRRGCAQPCRGRSLLHSLGHCRYHPGVEDGGHDEVRARPLLGHDVG